MRPTWVEISRSALRHNYRILHRHAEAAGAGLLCVVKADAYGHGLGICGQVLAEEGARWLGVTSVEEGVRLREALAEISTHHHHRKDVIPTGASAGRAVEEPAAAFAVALASKDIYPEAAAATEAPASAAALASKDIYPEVAAATEAPASAVALASEIGPGFSPDNQSAKMKRALAPATKPCILVMCGAWKGEAEAALEHDLTPVVWEPYQLDLLEQGARRAGIAANCVPVHLEVETGMARQGVALRDLPAMLARLHPRTGTRLKFDGLHTHYASAENHASDQNHQQTSRFCQAALSARHADMWPRYLHGGNSSTLTSNDGTLPRLHELARGLGAHLLVRPGLAMYGYLLPEQLQTGERAAEMAAKLRPVLSWKTRVIGIREISAGDAVGYGATWTAKSQRRIALLPVGYADGFSRRMSGGNVTESDTNSGGSVLLRGRRAPIVGRVSMDLTTIDITDIPSVEVGDEVALLGAQENESITADEMGRLRQTVSYEVLCGVGARVRRVAVE
jgi:alanine racemase